MRTTAIIGAILFSALQAWAVSGHKAIAGVSRPVRHQVTCTALRANQTVTSPIFTARPVCFSTEIAAGEALQLTITQPDDLEIHVRNGATKRLVDSFDFGNETVTLTAPGSWRIEVLMLARHRGALAFSTTARPLPMADADRWQKAEIGATTANRSAEIENADKSLALRTALGDMNSLARAHILRGFLLSDKDWARARIEFEKGLELCRALDDVRCAAEAENNSGTMSRRLGDFEQASLRLGEAVRDWRKLGNENEGATLSNLGLMLCNSGEFDQGIRDLDQARRIQRGRDLARYSQDLNNLGLCYQKLAENEKAQGYFERAIAGFTRANKPNDLLDARLNLGRTFMLEGRLPQARGLLEQVLIGARALNAGRTTADSLRNLGQIFWRQSNLAEAEERFKEALPIDQKTGDRRGESSALYYLGLVAEKGKEISRGRDFFTRSLQMRRESGLLDDAADSLSALAELEYRDGNIEAARRDADEALTLLESVRSQIPTVLRASFYSRKRRFFDLLVEMAMASGTPQAEADGLLASERGRARALTDLLAGRGLLKPVPKELAERRTRINRQLSYLVSRLSEMAAENQAAPRKEIRRLLEENDETETAVRQSAGDLSLGRPLESVQELQRRYLPPDSALLEFHLGETRSYLWLVDAQQVRAYELPPEKKIETAAQPVVEGLGRILERRRSPARQAQFEKALENLSRTLLGPLSGVPLPGLLILVPDGILHRVPLAALHISTRSAALGLDHDLIQVPSAAYLVFGRKRRPVTEFRQSILALVDPVFSAGDPRVSHPPKENLRPGPEIPLSRLPFNGEIDTIKALVPPSRRTILRGFQASRAMVEKISLRDYAVLHFSTHAMIDDQIPESSGIALSLVDHHGHPVDGFLLPAQLAQFQLDGSVVVLSACDTALGKQVPGEGLAGLTSSLLYAGGAQLVLTLTRIDAEGSSSFLSEVYRQFLTGHAGMERAVTLARRKMAHSRRFSDPYYWASFIVVGQPAGAVPF